MAIANINNGESGSSVRGKLNSVIDEVSPIEAAAEGSVFQKGATAIEAISRQDFEGDLYLQQSGIIPNSINGVSPTSDANYQAIYSLSGVNNPNNSESFIEIEVDRFGTRDSTGERNEVAFRADANNYFAVRIVGGSSGYLSIIKCISGVVTEVLRINKNLLFFLSATTKISIFGSTGGPSVSVFSPEFSGEIQSITILEPSIQKNNIVEIAFKYNPFAPFKGIRLRSQGRKIG